MILIVCVDDNMGMAFNHRRQSKDKVLKERMLQTAAGCHLWMSAYSAGQFEEATPKEPAINTATPMFHIHTDDSFMEKVGPGEYCFAETTDVLPFENSIEKLILYRWNRRYPADLYFNIPLEDHGWKLIHTEDFSGHSHEKITEEIYIP